MRSLMFAVLTTAFALTACGKHHRPLQPPQHVEAKGLVGKIHLTWDDVSNAQSFTVERSLNGDTFDTLAVHVTTTSYMDNGLSPGIEYSYRVRSVSLNRVSRPSATVAAKARDSHGRDFPASVN